MSTSEERGPVVNLATCSYTEFLPHMGVPLRCTVGGPRWRLPYVIAGQIRSVTPRRDMLKMDEQSYTLAYLRILANAGVDAILAELRQAMPPDADTAVLLCFENLSKEPKPGKEHNWCHRSLFARWWTEVTGQAVPELGSLPASGVAYTPLNRLDAVLPSWGPDDPSAQDDPEVAQRLF